MSVVLVATNGSPACGRAVARTPELFAGASVVVATVVPGGDPSGATRASAGSDPTPEGRDASVRAIADDLAIDAATALLRDACRTVGDRARPLLLSGDPVDAIIHGIRRSGARTLVVGSLGGGAIAGALGTSVGAALVSDAPCSVIELG